MRLSVDHAMERLAQARPVTIEEIGTVFSPSEENDLLTGILSDAGPEPTRPRIRPERRGAGLVIAAVAAVVVSVVVYASVPGNGRHVGSAPATLSGHWRLTGYFQPNWQQSLAGPTAGALTCPTTQVCYIPDGNAVANPIGHVPGPAIHLFVSTDHGATWTNVNPEGVSSFSSALVCPEGNARDCMAGGLEGTNAVLLVTTDGGASWVGRPLPPGAGKLIDLACTSSSRCVGVFSTSTDFYSSDGVVFVTDDGGGSWTPADTGGVLLQILSCADSTCVGSGFIPGPTPTSKVTIVNLYSDDSGSSWSKSTVPPGFGFLDGSAESLDCSDATHCLGIGGIETTPGHALTGATVASSDGGASWQLVPALSGIQAFAIACPTQNDCYVGGGGSQKGDTSQSITFRADGQNDTQVGSGSGREIVPVPVSPWVYSSVDGGTTWSKTTLAVPKGVPFGTSGSSLEFIGQLSCPSALICVGLGTGDETGQHTATYTNAPVGPGT
jgi:photosystem II stability/assembly factor-like uncharacterized protein